MKIGVITIYAGNYNYGGILQCYALPYFLNTHGFECEQIRYGPAKHSIKDILKRTRLCDLPGKVLVKVRYSIETKVKNFITFVFIGKTLDIRKEKYQSFEENIPHSQEMYTEMDIEYANDIYDGFICGSDVIWGYFAYPYIGALGFVRDGKRRFSYAPSLYIWHAEGKWLEDYKPYLDRLDAISVREQSVQEEMQAQGIQAITMPDPTFLLTRSDWSKVAVKPSYKERYVLAYLLGENRCQRKLAQEIAAQRDCKLVMIPFCNCDTFRLCDIGVGDIKDKDSGPAEFLGLIQNAECVVTDSFHAVVFSLIFHTPFWALPRRTKEGDASSRVINLLKDFNLEGRFIRSRMEEKCDIDFQNVDRILDEKRKKGQSFLLSMLAD